MVQSAEILTGVLGDTGLELFAQGVVVEIATDEHQLILAFSSPVAVVDGKAFAGQMEHVPPRTLVEPEDALGPEHSVWKLIVKKVLELAQAEGAVTAERQGGETFDREVIRRLMVVAVAMIMTVPVIVAVSMVMAVPMVVAVIVVMAVVVILSSADNAIRFVQAHAQKQR